MRWAGLGAFRTMSRPASRTVQQRRGAGLRAVVAGLLVAVGCSVGGGRKMVTGMSAEGMTPLRHVTRAFQHGEAIRVVLAPSQALLDDAFRRRGHWTRAIVARRLGLRGGSAESEEELLDGEEQHAAATLSATERARQSSHTSTSESTEELQVQADASAAERGHEGLAPAMLAPAGDVDPATNGIASDGNVVTPLGARVGQGQEALGAAEPSRSRQTEGEDGRAGDGGEERAGGDGDGSASETGSGEKGEGMATERGLGSVDAPLATAPRQVGMREMQTHAELRCAAVPFFLPSLPPSSSLPPSLPS